MIHLEAGTRISSRDDIARLIRYVAEQQWALYRQAHFPHLTLYHEPIICTHPNTGKVTTPDFIEVDEKTKKMSFVELTIDYLTPTKDPKGRQKEIMQAAYPDIPYNVKYGQDLQAIQRDYPGFNFQFARLLRPAPYVLSPFYKSKR